MAFNNVLITGSGESQVAITNDTTREAIINSLVAYNTTGTDAVFILLINDVAVVTETVSANGSFRMPDKLNVPASSVLKVNADTGVNVTVSYLQQISDVAASITSINQLVLDAAESADRAENALPEGSIDDSSISTTGVYSSSKIETLVTEVPLIPLKSDKSPLVRDNGTITTSTAVINLANGYKQKITIGAALTLSITGWPTTGLMGELELEVVNGGAFVVTLPDTNWLIAKGAFSQAFADTKVVLNAAGSNTLIFWSDDAGTVVSGVVG